MIKTFSFFKKNKFILFLFIIDLVFYLSLFLALWVFGLFAQKYNWTIEQTTTYFLMYFLPILFLKIYKEISKNKRENIYGKKK